MSNGTYKKIILKSKLGKVPSNFQNYFDEAGENDLNSSFENQRVEIEKLFSAINEEQSQKKYAEDKWTIKEVLQHIIDAERVFAYRALAFARKDENTLPSFDEKEYAINCNANNR
ncbi:MAG: DinB family protein, partial [Bacteroidota bacterium]|nr:DinB family protein [Bacteroidota bacterium]